MLIKISQFLARLLPAAWKREIDLVVKLKEMVWEAARDKLWQLYALRIRALRADSSRLLAEMEEITAMREVLKRLWRPRILRMAAMKHRPEVSIIIPVYSNHDDFLRLMKHLDSETLHRDFEVVLVNDCPPEPLPDSLVSGQFRFPLICLQSAFNQGYAAATNVGAKHAKGQFLLLLNTDTLPANDDWLDRMLGTMSEYPGTGIVGAKTVFYGSNTIEHFGMYPIQEPGSGLWANAHYFQGVDDGLFGETQIDQETDMVTGACLLIRSNVFLEVNGLHEGYIVGGYEDSDLCRRVRARGFGIRVSARAILNHRKSASLMRSDQYSDQLHLCNKVYYNHIWRSTIEKAEAEGRLHHPMHRDANRLRVLFVAHGHPPQQVGGTEIYNQYLARAVGRLSGFESVILARGFLKGPAADDGMIVQDREAFDTVPVFRCLRLPMEFLNVHPRAELEFQMFLYSIRPDVVHFNHTENLSVNFVTLAKNGGRRPIVYTLNEYLPICARQGLMVHRGGTLCSEAQIDKCALCAGVNQADIEKRNQLYRRNFSQVDVFVAPSRHLTDTYVNWGLRREHIYYSQYGMVSHSSPTTRDPGQRLRFVYLGQILPHKGITILLDAVEALARSHPDRFEVHIHGNMHPDSGTLEEFNKLTLRRIGALKGTLLYNGPYANHEVATILAHADVVVAPSIWWENSPITIQEAFSVGVPVITSNVGGMKELVQHKVHGLLFEVKNSAALAAAMISLIEDPEQLRQFRENLRMLHVKTIEENAAELADVYRKLLARPEN